MGPQRFIACLREPAQRILAGRIRRVGGADVVRLRWRGPLLACLPASSLLAPLTRSKVTFSDIDSVSFIGCTQALGQGAGLAVQAAAYLKLCLRSGPCLTTLLLSYKLHCITLTVTECHDIQ